MEDLLLALILRVRLDEELRLLDQVVQHGLQLENVSGFMRVDHLHRLPQVQKRGVGHGGLAGRHLLQGHGLRLRVLLMKTTLCLRWDAFLMQHI